MNERAEVVAWRLTTSTGFSEIEDLLNRLKLRPDKSDSRVVDDCCRVRNKYHQIFPGAEVKLDLFHACQRVVRTMPVTNRLYNDAVRSRIQIFRQNDDQGDTRLKSTPGKDVIGKNLESFLQRWIASNQSIPYIPFFPDDVLSSEPIYVAYHFYGAGSGCSNVG